MSLISRFVCLSVVIMLSLEHSKHLKQNVLRELQGCLRGVCLKFQGCFKEVSRMFHGSLRVCTDNIKGVSRKFKECFEEVLRVFQGSFRKTLKVVSRVLKYE